MMGPDAYTAVNPGLAGAGSHFNSEAWSWLDNGDYLEAGIRNGVPVTGEPYGTYYFWADHQVGTRDVEFYHGISSLAFNPSHINIYNWQRCNTIYHWCFYFDGSKWGESTVTASQGGNWAITQLQVGGELASLNCDNGSAYAPDRQMSASVLDTNWNWSHPWLGTLRIDSPCGFEGTNHGAIGVWSWQKHSPP